LCRHNTHRSEVFLRFVFFFLFVIWVPKEVSRRPTKRNISYSQ
jgi:hypothetical protein